MNVRRAAAFAVLAILAPLAAPAAAAEPPKGLIIVTTDAIRARSQALDAFVAAKERRGFTVLVATEAQYGAAVLKGQPRAIAIREWLKGAAAGYGYLLLVGDAHPDYGDVPMLRAWPRHTYPAGQCSFFAVDCRSMETDAFYANLTGDWDLNGNGRFGEHGLDDGAGGIDFTPQLVVGRIPVYFDEAAPLDAILRHALDHMDAPAGLAGAGGWRSRVLLPAAFYYFQGEHAYATNVDGADTAEWFVKNRLAPRPGFPYTRLYERDGLAPSAHAAELPITAENVVAEWAKGYGMVFWFGHGLQKEVARVIWAEDADGDGKAGTDETTFIDFLTSDLAAGLPADRGAFVVAVSCEVGSAETPDNLAYALQRRFRCLAKPPTQTGKFGA